MEFTPATESEISNLLFIGNPYFHYQISAYTLGACLGCTLGISSGCISVPVSGPISCRRHSGLRPCWVPLAPDWWNKLALAALWQQHWCMFRSLPQHAAHADLSQKKKKNKNNLQLSVDLFSGFSFLVIVFFLFFQEFPVRLRVISDIIHSIIPTWNKNTSSFPFTLRPIQIY